MTGWRWLLRALLIGAIAASLITLAFYLIAPHTPCPVNLYDEYAASCGVYSLTI